MRGKCPCLELFWSIFSRIWIEYGEMQSICLYSVRMRENADQDNSEYRHFLRSVSDSENSKNWLVWTSDDVLYTDPG